MTEGRQGLSFHQSLVLDRGATSAQIVEVILP
jgi:hypothetical protein